MAAIMGLALTACRTDVTLVTPDPHLERMLKQEKALPYEEDPFLPKGMAMQQPPDGTETTDAPVGEVIANTGVANGRYVDRIPIPVDRPLVEAGRQRFDVICATCHGVLGDGVSAVAVRMDLRKPPTLLGAVRDYAPGRIFSVVRLGYGLMPSYRVQLSVTETWAVVAYVRALQLARGAHESELPPRLKARLEAP